MHVGDRLGARRGDVEAARLEADVDRGRHEIAIHRRHDARRQHEAIDGEMLLERARRAVAPPSPIFAVSMATAPWGVCTAIFCSPTVSLTVTWPARALVSKVFSAASLAASSGREGCATRNAQRSSAARDFKPSSVASTTALSACAATLTGLASGSALAAVRRHRKGGGEIGDAFLQNGGNRTLAGRLGRGRHLQRAGVEPFVDAGRVRVMVILSALPDPLRYQAIAGSITNRPL